MTYTSRDACCREPTTDDIVNIVHQMYKDDGLSQSDIQQLVETFSGQTLDFFGAVRASTYDHQIRHWVVEVSGGPSHVSQIHFAHFLVSLVNNGTYLQALCPHQTPITYVASRKVAVATACMGKCRTLSVAQVAALPEA